MAKDTKIGLAGTLGIKKSIDIEKIDKMVQKLENPEVKKTVKQSKKIEQERIVKTSIHYPFDIYKKLKMRAMDSNISVKEYVIRLLRKDLK